MKPWVSWPKTEGTASRQAHCDLPRGTYEREMGKEGFSGPATHLYHPKPPTSWSHIEGPLKPRAFNLNGAAFKHSGPQHAVMVLKNPFVQIRVLHLNESMPTLFRNADGDDLIFLHRGTAEFYSDFGHLSLKEGDYLAIPRASMWRLEIKNPIELLLIEATNDHFQLPEKGLLGEHALFDPAMLDTPCLDDAFLEQKDAATVVIVKREDVFTTISYDYNPLDAVGWHGTLMPMRINWRDFRPVMSHRYHIPPSIHATFVSSRFMVTTFCPRPVESDPGALKLPFYHNNNDYDEVIFYHQGSFLSRDDIGPGMISFHPVGLTHGPHPEAYRKAEENTRTATDEVAVMIDARDYLQVCDDAKPFEQTDYWQSWK